jgi:hypothetical protein
VPEPPSGLSPRRPAPPPFLPRQAAPPPTAQPEAEAETGRVILVPGVPRYHRGGCILIRFLSVGDVESVTREAAKAAGCVPCRACEPDRELPGTG